LAFYLQAQKAIRDIFYQRHRGYDSAVRSQALNLMLSPSSSISSDDVADILSQSTDPWNTDYSLYIQARLFDAAQRIPTIRSIDDLLTYFLSFCCILYCFRKPCADSSLPAIVFSDAEKVKAFYSTKWTFVKSQDWHFSSRILLGYC